MKDAVIIYHDLCRDGFGSAYAAWKKFGEDATYIGRKTGEPVPEGIEDKEVYILDYSYPKEVFEELVKNNKSVVVIDHHKSAEEVVTSFSQNIFDVGHSGAVLSWMHFHPDTEVPKLLLYVEDHDLWKMDMPHNREFGTALAEYKLDFEVWDKLNTDLEDNNFFDTFIERGKIISGFENRLVKGLLEFREPVICEGHDVYAVNCERTYRSIIGNKLAALNQREGRTPFGIVYYRYDGKFHCSLRSLKGFDVSVIAQKYGGGGHPGAASIRVDKFDDLPFTYK